MRKIEELLKEHKEKKTQLDIIEARIEAYEVALRNPDIRDTVHYVSPGTYLGMPKTDNFGSITEKSIMTEEAICEALRNLISTEESRASHLRNKVEPVDKALKALTVQQKFLIECRYFEELGWNDTERNFNEKFYEKEPEKRLTVHRLYKIKDKALDRLENILYCR